MSSKENNDITKNEQGSNFIHNIIDQDIANGKNGGAV